MLIIQCYLICYAFHIISCIPHGNSKSCFS